MRLKKVTVEFAAVLICFNIVFNGCDFKKEQDLAIKEITLSIDGEPEVLDPQLVGDVHSMRIINAVFEGLCRNDENGIPMPGMAKSWDVSEDKLTYTFHLREALWADGSQVTAMDFKEAWLRALNPNAKEQQPSPLGYLLMCIEGAESYFNGEGSRKDVAIEVKDEKTLVVKLKQPTPYFLQIVCNSVAMPINGKFYVKEQLANDIGEYGAKAQNILGNGPFIVKEWKHNKYIALEKNPNYWNAENIKIDRIIFKIITDNPSAIAAFEKGELDIAEISQANQIEELKAKGFRIEDYNTGKTQYILFNMEDKYLKNINLRKALTYGIERDNLVNNVVKNGSKGAYAFVNPVVRGVEKSFREETGDLVTGFNVSEAESFALKSLVELKLSDLPKLTLLIDDSEISKRDAQAIREMWRKNVGIEVEIEALPLESVKERLLQKEYQMVLLRWAGDCNDPILFLEIFEIGNSFNAAGFNISEYDQLINKARKEVDEKKRMNLLREAEELLFNYMPICPLYYVYDSYAIKHEIKGFVRGSSAIQDMDLYWTYLE
ncbi:peptide ABC transporter substrate-binding protein [Acetivibrio clariflavus]|uniref:ABC-type oligopeptide transport system, periplasmic component n=1 Tax=Acetivibrio clariflavus (strain DSM 19732 / NBRC 101661 / EBR45) TaxID=720554 RepID=G8LT37_ACECE|nr:peptide ABC transporter substrate-binding protein [Acetivibrio clariflavus]AEV67241.1 ABC-type oligopeptide transport system, periplasmic component [Acetivibrio clariflavus DSM 19732]HOQ01745.1 peptide ABC transporter substrate-binding protein [Acetivibrio clariflavus]